MEMVVDVVLLVHVLHVAGQPTATGRKVPLTSTCTPGNRHRLLNDEQVAGSHALSQWCAEVLVLVLVAEEAEEDVLDAVVDVVTVDAEVVVEVDAVDVVDDDDVVVVGRQGSARRF